MGKFVVAGITQVETIVRVEQVPIVYTPLTTEVNSIYTGLGGDAYNESLALRWLGDDVKFMSIIGRDRSVDELNPPGNEIQLSTEYVVQRMEETPNCVILYDKDRRKQIVDEDDDGPERAAHPLRRDLFQKFRRAGDKDGAAQHQQDDREQPYDPFGTLSEVFARKFGDGRAVVPRADHAAHVVVYCAA